MPHILDTIVGQKRAEVRALKSQAGGFGARRTQPRGFSAAISRRPLLSVIAEVKKASPSKGVIRPDFDAVAIGRSYKAGGAAAISVLTDERFFMGSTGYLTAVREAVDLPVLRKDFIIDPVQVEQTAALDADAMLLIAAILDDTALAELHAAAIELGIDPLVEVHDRAELERVLRIGPKIIGINNRDLRTFTCDLSVTAGLAGLVPPSIPVVSESGIENAGQTAALMKAGVSAILVGESLMRCSDPGPLIRELSHAGKN